MKSAKVIEKHLLLDGILMRYGYDFRQYTGPALDRRLDSVLTKLGHDSLIDILKHVLASNENFKQILPELTIDTTEFFRDPEFFKSLRDEVFPILRTYPTLTIWCAGCSTGEEVMSLAITLKEEGLLGRSRIYATDINPAALKSARQGIYSMSGIESFNKNYTLSGGNKNPSEYYTAEYGLVRFDSGLQKNVTYSEHNLVTDDVFVEAHLIICRNVFIYFNRELQDRVFELFHRSLALRGFLVMGPKESMRFSKTANSFEIIDDRNRIYRHRLSPVKSRQEVDA